jgi:fatty acid desaturase
VTQPAKPESQTAAASPRRGGERRSGGFEWPTLALALGIYAAWFVGVSWASALWLPLGIALAAVAGALHSSLTHEALHGHPSGNSWFNGALVFPTLTLFIPYLRFKDTHLDHHRDARLTDPYDDPESNFQDPETWAAMPGWKKTLLAVNNTLAGRMALGPLWAQICFMQADWRAIRAGDRRVLAGWILHVPSVAVVIWVVLAAGAMPLWALVVSAYLSLAILKIRTFLEHRAHERARARTVIIEDRGILAFLFLNNSLHAVHHIHPRVAWYRLPGVYFGNKARYLERNDSYVYRSYAEVFRRYFLTAKDPVPHPLWKSPETETMPGQ